MKIYFLSCYPRKHFHTLITTFSQFWWRWFPLAWSEISYSNWWIAKLHATSLTHWRSCHFCTTILFPYPSCQWTPGITGIIQDYFDCTIRSSQIFLYRSLYSLDRAIRAHRITPPKTNILHLQTLFYRYNLSLIFILPTVLLDAFTKYAPFLLLIEGVYQNLILEFQSKLFRNLSGDKEKLMARKYMRQSSPPVLSPWAELKSENLKR